MHRPNQACAADRIAEPGRVQANPLKISPALRGPPRAGEAEPQLAELGNRRHGERAPRAIQIGGGWTAAEPAVYLSHDPTIARDEEDALNVGARELGFEPALKPQVQNPGARVAQACEELVPAVGLPAAAHQAPVNRRGRAGRDRPIPPGGGAALVVERRNPGPSGL